MKSIPTRLFRYCPKTGKIMGLQPLVGGRRWMFPFIGIAALVWFLVRVVPKPSRAGYPCQRVALPLASSFVLWVLGIAASALALSRTKLKTNQRRFINLALCLAVMGLSFGLLDVNARDLEAVAYTPHPVNSPIGLAKGLMPGRVAWVHDPLVTDWNGSATNASQSWFNHIDQAEATKMMQWALKGYAGTTTTADAWDAIFHSFNDGSAGYQSGEKIFIKVNFVTTGGDTCADTNYNWTPTSCGLAWTSVATSPQLMVALLDQLVNVAGVAQSDITIGDSCGKWVNEFYNIVHGIFPDVNYMDARGTLGRTHAARSTTRLYWSTTEDDGKNPDYLLQAVVDARYMINFAVLKSHERNGITVTAKNHYGTLSGGDGDVRKPDTTNYYNIHLRLPLDNTAGAWPQRASMAQYRPIVDLNGDTGMGGKTLLYLIDGIFSGRGWAAAPSTWAMTPFNNNWPSSLFLSMDQVAIDSVAFDFLSQQWPDQALGNEGVQDYLHEMALADDPPSGTFYDPENDSLPMTSQGVHEHWNNAVDKQYSRNLGSGDGIELVYLNPNLAPQSFSKSSPQQGAVGVSTSPTLEWGSSDYAGSYQYCIDTSNDDLCDGDVWQEAGTSTSAALSGLDYDTTYYWQVQAVNEVDTTDADSGSWWSFSTGPAETCIEVSVVAGWNMSSVPVVAGDMRLSTLFSGVIAPAYSFTNAYQPVGADDTLTPSLGYWTYFTAANTFEICGQPVTSTDIAVNAGWNMIGPFDTAVDVAVITSDPTGILQPPLYGYTNTYQPLYARDDLTPGLGYWTYFTAANTFEICGQPVTSTDIAVNVGWNMIGPFDTALAVAAITSDPTGILQLPLYGYSSAYFEATTLNPGLGYWVYVSTAGTLHLEAAESQAFTRAVDQDESCALSWQSAIAISDGGASSATLYIGQGPAASSGLDRICGESPLPPKPLSGAFAARLVLPGGIQASGADYRSILGGQLEWRIELQPASGEGPLSLSWDPTSLPAGSWRLLDPLGGGLVNLDMTTQGSCTLTSLPLDTLVIQFVSSSPLYTTHLPFIRR